MSWETETEAPNQEALDRQVVPTIVVMGAFTLLCIVISLIPQVVAKYF